MPLIRTFFFLSLSTDEIIPAILLVFLLFKFCKHCVKFLSEDKFCEPRYIRICPGSTECHFNQYKGFTIVGLMSKRKNCTIALRLKSSGVSPAIGFVFKFRMFHVKFLDCFIRLSKFCHPFHFLNNMYQFGKYNSSTRLPQKA